MRSEMFPPFNKLTAAHAETGIKQLQRYRFQDPAAAFDALARLRADSMSGAPPKTAGRSVPAWYKTLKRVVSEAPAPDNVLAILTQFVQRCSSAETAFAFFEETPRTIEVIARLSCGSQFLTQCMLQQPEALQSLLAGHRIAEIKDRETFYEEASAAVRRADSHEGRLDQLRRYQRREILRIGMCDAFGLVDLRVVTLQLSLLADALIQVALDLSCRSSGAGQWPLAVLAFGKLGGEELNYSSDIDLVFISSALNDESQRIARRLIEILETRRATGFLYRVDMRLRPWGDAGPLVVTVDSYEEYLHTSAELWERQSLLKARFVAGDAHLAAEFLQRLPDYVLAVEQDDVLASIQKTKSIIETRLRQSGRLESEVKLGVGSIRDVEFLTQALQLIHGRHERRVLSANTLDALIRLTEFEILPVSDYRQLREGYVFFRHVEHALQLLHNQQTHELPTDADQLDWLARRLDFQNTAALLDRFHQHRQAVRRIFDRHFLPATADSVSNSEQPVAVAQTHRPPAAESGRALPRQQLKQLQLLTKHFAQPSAAQRCTVSAESVGNDSDEVFVRIVAQDSPPMLAMLAAAFSAEAADIREGIATAGVSHADAGLDLPDGLFAGVFRIQRPRQSGRDPSAECAELATRLEQRVNELSLIHERHGVNQLNDRMVDIFCKNLGDRQQPPAAISDVSVHMSPEDGSGMTRLDVTGADSIGFLFEVSNALSICGFRICVAHVSGHDGRIRDVLYVTEASGEAVTAAERLKELKTAVTLIRQFTAWLPLTSDPPRALTRFRDFIRQLRAAELWAASEAAFARPEILSAVARVLGISRYLWEDFLQLRADRLLPLLQAPETLAARMTKRQLVSELRQRVSRADDLPQVAVVLNLFKDDYLFRTDLRHVLGYSSEFGVFAEEMTDLAETVVEFAFEYACRHLENVYGPLKKQDGSACRYTVCALGKFGGREMGIASDLELFVVYEDDAHTTGNRRLSAGSFFERVVATVQQLIASRRKGIFEIDLRMRPYGQAGSAAVSLETFQTYYAAGGDAWPYERQSLVRLRTIGGDAEFAAAVQNCANRAVYRVRSFDFDAMRALREKQVRQLVRPGTINAKLSSGGLVDCEYAVQALQMTFGAEVPDLQTPNTQTALSAASRNGYIVADEFRRIRNAYQFLRQLIDCLRMVRGNAEDLTVPAKTSVHFKQLVHRMAVVHGTDMDWNTLEDQMKAVRRFSEYVEEICRAAVRKSCADQ